MATRKVYVDVKVNIILEIEKDIKGNLEKAFLSGAIPEDWIDNNDFRTVKSVVDSYCVDRVSKYMENHRNSL